MAASPPPCPACLGEGHHEVERLLLGAPTDECPRVEMREVTCEKCGGDGRARCAECGDPADVERHDGDKVRAYCGECIQAQVSEAFGGAA